MVLEVSGHLVADEDDNLFKAEVQTLVAGGCRSILLDLRDVSYLDSGGAGVLASTLLHVTRRGGQLKLVCPSDRVCRVLQTTHLLSVFDVFQDEESAIRSFDAPPVGAGRRDPRLT